MLSPCVIIPVLSLIKAFGIDVLTTFMGCFLNCACCCNTIGWWIAGIVWRFKAAGSYAAGDLLSKTELQAAYDDDDTLYQLRSGKFLLVFYIINWVLMGGALITLFFSCLCTCLCNLK